MLILKNSSLLSLNQFLSLKELLIFNTLLFQYKVLKKNQIDISELKEKIGIKYSQNKHLKDVLNKLNDKILSPKYLNKSKEIKEDGYKLFQYFEIVKKSIKFKFSVDLLKFIDSKDSSFYNLDFKNILDIKHVHSITLYELIVDFSLKDQKKTTLYFNFNFLRKIFGLEDKYGKNSEFKNKVIYKIIENMKQFENIELILLEKRNKYILKINSSIEKSNEGVIDEINNWLLENPDEIELYKEALISSNENIPPSNVHFDHVRKVGSNYFATFKYKSFLLDVKIIEEDLKEFLEKEKNCVYDI